MNKDKLIAEINKLSDSAWEEHASKEIDRYWQGKSRAFTHSVTVINRLLQGYVIVPIGWAEVAECPIPSCVDGGYYNDHGEAEQCQFCYEKEAMIAAHKDNT